MLRTLVSSIVSGFFAVMLFASPVAAQVDIDGESNDFGPLTSEEQATLFDAGVEAYDEGDFAAAYHIWLPLAQNGNMSAQRNIGHLLRRGIGIEQDYERAIYFYTRASENGLVSAMVNLASMMRAGHGFDGPQNEEAARWLYIAANAGDPRAQYVLGVMAARGEGMPADRDLAIRLFTMAAEQGLREARLRLGEAGIEPENIGDAPERSEGAVPSSLEPLPDFAPQTSRQPVIQPRLRTTQTAPVTMPQAAASPSVAQPTTEPATRQTTVRIPSGSSGTTGTTGTTQPRVASRTAPVLPQAQPLAQPQPQAQARVQTPPAVRPQPEPTPPAEQSIQNVPTVQSVSVQPTPLPGQRRAQPVMRSTSDLVVLPPASSTGAQPAIVPVVADDAPEEEEMSPGLSRLLGGTQ